MHTTSCRELEFFRICTRWCLGSSFPSSSRPSWPIDLLRSDLSPLCLVISPGMRRYHKVFLACCFSRSNSVMWLLTSQVQFSAPSTWTISRCTFRVLSFYVWTSTPIGHRQSDIVVSFQGISNFCYENQSCYSYRGVGVVLCLHN